MIIAIIPVLNQNHYTNNILYRISKNIVKPDKVLLIDDGSTENVKEIVRRYQKQVDIRYKRNKKTIGVNSSWNLGLKLCEEYNPDYVSILNNDLVLNHYFFKKIIGTYEKYPKAGIVCPNTVKKASMVKLDDASGVEAIRMGGSREGWAFTLKYDIYKKAGPIPVNRFKQFCGDDYMFFMSRRQGYLNLKMKNNLIYHYKNTTLKNELPGWKGQILRKEKFEFNKWKKEYLKK